MSTKILATPNLGLLIASLTQALWHALAFCRTVGVHALGAPRAPVLHAPAPSRRVSLPPTPALVLTLPARSRRAPTPPSPQSRPGPLLALYSAATASRHRHPDNLCPGRRRPSHTSAPAAPGAAQAYPEARLLAPVAATRPQLQNSGSPAILCTAAAEPTSNAYIRGPRAQPSTQATSFYPPSAPTPSNRRREAFFPVSDQFGRRHNPVQCDATRASPTHPTPPFDSPRLCGVAQPLSFDREPP